MRKTIAATGRAIATSATPAVANMHALNTYNPGARNRIADFGAAQIAHSAIPTATATNIIDQCSTAPSPTRKPQAPYAHNMQTSIVSASPALMTWSGDMRASLQQNVRAPTATHSQFPAYRKAHRSLATGLSTLTATFTGLPDERVFGLDVRGAVLVVLSQLA